MPHATPPAARLVESVISTPRFAKYVQAAGGNDQRAADLYGWNARVSAALLVPAHFAEITVRNVVHDALTAVYGPHWPWNTTFQGSLPSPPPQQGYNPRHDLTNNAQRQGATRATGKVIAELKFVFWQMMFTRRHQTRIWDQRIAGLLPNAGAVSGQASEGALRGRVYNDLETIRKVRNRMAHHEPIHTRNLTDDLQCMLDLINFRCVTTSQWVRDMQDVSGLLQLKP